jgi:hypothetical protein
MVEPPEKKGDHCGHLRLLPTLLDRFHSYFLEDRHVMDGLCRGVSQVRKEIARGLVNNIYKVCIIVRKRSISKLSKNFISPRNIRNLVMLILKPANFRNVKQEYSSLWNFISRNHEETYFKTVSDENYKLIYRELIILAETFKINDGFIDEAVDVGFESSILRQSADPFALLNDFRSKKNRQLTIDLVSDQEEEQE